MRRSTVFILTSALPPAHAPAPSLPTTTYYGIDGLLWTREVFGWSLERSNEWLLARASG
jgi:hypothetical protein